MYDAVAGIGCLKGAAPMGAEPSCSISSVAADATLTVGRNAAGAVREIFLDLPKASDLAEMASESALAASLALQYGVPPDRLRHALAYREAGPLGVALALIDEARHVFIVVNLDTPAEIAELMYLLTWFTGGEPKFTPLANPQVFGEAIANAKKIAAPPT